MKGFFIFLRIDRPCRGGPGKMQPDADAIAPSGKGINRCDRARYFFTTGLQPDLSVCNMAAYEVLAKSNPTYPSFQAR